MQCPYSTHTAGSGVETRERSPSAPYSKVSDFPQECEAWTTRPAASPDEMFLKIKERYDGYHFSAVSEDIYNPFSLLNAFDDDELTNSWFASGTPTFLIHQMQHFRTDIMAMDGLDTRWILPTSPLTSCTG